MLTHPTSPGRFPLQTSLAMWQIASSATIVCGGARPAVNAHRHGVIANDGHPFIGGGYVFSRVKALGVFFIKALSDCWPRVLEERLDRKGRVLIENLNFTGSFPISAGFWRSVPAYSVTGKGPPGNQSAGKLGPRHRVAFFPFPAANGGHTFLISFRKCCQR